VNCRLAPPAAAASQQQRAVRGLTARCVQDDGIEMFIPGGVYHIVRRDFQQFVLPVDAAYFADIELSASMLTDHLFDTYLEGLRLALAREVHAAMRLDPASAAARLANGGGAAAAAAPAGAESASSPPAVVAAAAAAAAATSISSETGASGIGAIAAGAGDSIPVLHSAASFLVTL
jgi:hypothetical protein